MVSFPDTDVQYDTQSVASLGSVHSRLSNDESQAVEEKGKASTAAAAAAAAKGGSPAAAAAGSRHDFLQCSSRFGAA